MSMGWTSWPSETTLTEEDARSGDRPLTEQQLRETEFPVPPGGWHPDSLPSPLLPPPMGQVPRLPDFSALLSHIAPGDVENLKALLFELRQHWFHPATMGRTVTVNVNAHGDGAGVQAAKSNPLRTAFVIPSGVTANLYLGMDGRVSPTTGFAIPNGWQFGPEYTGEVWLAHDGATAYQVICMEFLAPPLGG